MNGKRAKAIKKEVINKTYGEDWAKSSKEDKKAELENPQLKSMIRRAKKNAQFEKRYGSNNKPNC